jgi:hypothetical protein
MIQSWAKRTGSATQIKTPRHGSNISAASVKKISPSRGEINQLYLNNTSGMGFVLYFGKK